MIRVLVFTLGILSISCTSALKKQCQETNWFDHGRKVAMRGERLNADNFSLSCRREGVDPDTGQLDLGFKAGMSEYCKPDVAYQTGRKGQFLNLEFCNPNHASTLKARHHEGVVAFCDKSNAFSFGASGVTYNNICPKEMEPAFLKEYRRGRKGYLGQMILGKESELNALEAEAARFESERNRLSVELASLPRETTVSRTHVKDPLGGSSDHFSIAESDSSKSRRDSLRWDIDRANRNIDQVRLKQQEIRKEILAYKTEKEGLE